MKSRAHAGVLANDDPPNSLNTVGCMTSERVAPRAPGVFVMGGWGVLPPKSTRVSIKGAFRIYHTPPIFGHTYSLGLPRTGASLPPWLQTKGHQLVRRLLKNICGGAMQAIVGD